MPLRLPELKRTPIKRRHPLVYGAGLLLLGALIAFLGGIPFLGAGGMGWVLVAAGLAVLMAIVALIIALRGPGASA
jgi:hypothetical protein